MTDETPTAAEEVSAPLEEPAAQPDVSETPPAVNPPQQMTRDSQNWATAAHLSAFIQFIGVPSLIGPLLVWLMKRDEDPYVADQAKEALNFNLSFLIYSVVAGLLIFVLIGVVLLPIVLIAWFVLVIVAAMAASRGESYRYPLTMRLVN